MAILLLFILLAPLLFLLILYILSRQKKPTQRNKQKIPKIIHPNSQLQSKLLAMMGGDSAAVERLLNREETLNPGHSEDWYLEKVIWSLERDRRA